jgi:Ca2+-binding RTX toxin-like protein
VIRRSVLVLLAAVAASVPAPPAQAAPTCTYTGKPGVVTVTISDPDTVADLIRSGTSIGLLIGGGFTPCGAATVDNTESIAVQDVSGGRTGFQAFLEGGPFAPGATDEGDGTSEIEFTVDLGTDGDNFVVVGGSGPERIRIGTLGVNLNGDTDLDVTMVGVERVIAYGRDGDDELTGTGGSGTGGVTTLALTLGGDRGNDLMEGGDGPDLLDDPLFGNDRLFGGGASDFIVAGRGGDVANGGPGEDTIEGGSGKDSLGGQAGPDLIKGERGPDRIIGGDQRDRLEGGDDNDRLRGNDGLDRLYGQAGNDGLDGGPHKDLCVGGPGVNTFHSCEAIS